MKILVVDQENFGLDFVLRCTAAGHAVKWFRFQKRPCRNGEGFGLDIVERWQDHAKWADLIVPTGNWKYLKELDDWRTLYGARVFGPSWSSAQLEINRGEGMRLFEAKGLNVAPYKQFTTLQAAKSHVLKTDQNYAFKTLGDEDNKSLTFVSKTPAQMVEWLDRKAKSGLVLKGPCMLQEKIEFVAEVGVACWLAPDGFLPGKAEISFEHKKLMPGGFGQNTGEMGTVCQYVEDDPLVEMLYDFEDDLIGRGHTGDTNINFGIDAQGKAWPFEWTMRLGWPDFFIRVAMQKGDPAQWMLDCLKGKDTLRVSHDPHIGVVCARCPFPYADGSPDEVEGHPIYGLEDVWDDIHPVDMMLGKGYEMTGEAITTGNVYRTTGTYVLVATGSGKTVADARKDVYRTVDEVILSDVVVRNDIGEGLEDSLPKLHKLGYAKGISYD
jgi:phosphoribosylamine---glycine ligase